MYLGHYLDDFVMAGRPLSDECHSNLALLIELCDLLGFPMASDKCKGPTTYLIFQGVELDTVKLKLSLRLSAEKLARLKGILKKWVICNPVENRSYNP